MTGIGPAAASTGSRPRPSAWTTARVVALFAAALLQPIGPALADSTAARTNAQPVSPRVVVVNFFGLEAAPWLAVLHADVRVMVPGLPAEFPWLQCTADAICQMTAGMGHANAAASMTALIYGGALDLRTTYFIIAGIAGIDPGHGTLGSAAWARFAVDDGIAHEIDARERPASWPDGYFGIMTTAPDQKPEFAYGSEVFRLDEALLQKALSLSGAVSLEDSDDARAYRSRYPHAPANQPPRVIGCDTVSGDTWWAGARLGDRARRWTELLTDGKGEYCTTQQEDNAILTALARGALSGLIDFRRIAILRSGADFDRPYPGQSVVDSMLAQRANTGAVRIAAANLVHAGMPLVSAIREHWESWQAGVPAAIAVVPEGPHRP